MTGLIVSLMQKVKTKRQQEGLALNREAVAEDVCDVVHEILFLLGKKKERDEFIRGVINTQSE